MGSALIYVARYRIDDLLNAQIFSQRIEITGLDWLGSGPIKFLADQVIV